MANVNWDCKTGDRLLVNGITVEVVDTWPNGVSCKHEYGNYFNWSYLELKEWSALRYE